ncbi:hypothetical protein GC089_08730 [Cellulomonas sp. JZ18]|uniref:hypothetical protein n=1 Tax=Cellulomonas sp. JZ18 TaxID=2654191 RepID=UPI0012D4B307|nr:hypothetical protein [Cellulomonas sp. JZ18]QGQ19299.1 hypothetical protein GC089_08730 [Cellulomonas sp. JZ18]
MTRTRSDGTPDGGPDGGRTHPRGVRALVDPTAGVLRLDAAGREAAVPLPPGVDWSTWHALVLEVDGRSARAELSHARLGDPLAVATLDLRRTTHPRAGTAGAVALTAGVRVDDLSALPPAPPTPAPSPLPEPGHLVADLTFDAGTGPGWTPVRDPRVTVEDGDLVWPVEQADLVGPGGTAGLLLRDAPAGDWTAETVVRLDLGVDTVRNYQQAGLVVHAHDDLFARLSHVAIWNTRQTELGHERPFADRTSYGGTIVGPPGDRTWLRLVHRTDAAGEREVRALTRTDTTGWAVGGVWTFPPGTPLRVGLAAHGWNGTDPRAVARFEHLRLWQD